MRPWRATRMLSMPLEIPNATNSASSRELVPWVSGDNSSQPLVGQRSTLSWASAANKKPSASVTASTSTNAAAPVHARGTTNRCATSMADRRGWGDAQQCAPRFAGQASKRITEQELRRQIQHAIPFGASGSSPVFGRTSPYSEEKKVCSGMRGPGAIGTLDLTGTVARVGEHLGLRTRPQRRQPLLEALQKLPGAHAQPLGG